MKRLHNYLIGVDQGAVVVFSDFENGGAMWRGSGPRMRRKAVTFTEPFKAVPTVTVTPAMWDYDSGCNTRGDLSAVEITPTGFTVVFRTWGDTRIARLRAAWSAIGPLSHDDDWQLR